MSHAEHKINCPPTLPHSCQLPDTLAVGDVYRCPAQCGTVWEAQYQANGGRSVMTWVVIS